MFQIHPHVQLLQIADGGADVRDFINGDGLPQRGAAGHQRHEGEEQNYGYGRFFEWMHRKVSILLWDEQMIHGFSRTVPTLLLPEPPFEEATCSPRNKYYAMGPDLVPNLDGADADFAPYLANATFSPVVKIKSFCFFPAGGLVTYTSEKEFCQPSHLFILVTV